MDTTEVLVIVAALVNLLALGGFLYWARGWFVSLKGTVKTQGETISALKTVLDVTDTPKMLERFEAYKRIVDHEKEALQRDLEMQLEEERKKRTQAGVDMIKNTEEYVQNFVHLVLDLMPYAPRESRREAIESSKFTEGLKDIFLKAADRFPEVSSRPTAFMTLQEALAVADKPIGEFLNPPKAPPSPTEKEK